MCVCERERERENGKRLESERSLCPCLLRDRATHWGKHCKVNELLWRCVWDGFCAVDPYSTRSRSLHVRSKCAGIRKHVSDSDCVVKINNGALNCSTESNVVVLLNCGSQVNSCFLCQFTSLSLSLSFSPPLSVLLDSYICICLSL